MRFEVVGWPGGDRHRLPPRCKGTGRHRPPSGVNRPRAFSGLSWAYLAIPEKNIRSCSDPWDAILGAPSPRRLVARAAVLLSVCRNTSIWCLMTASPVERGVSAYVSTATDFTATVGKSGPGFTFPSAYQTRPVGPWATFCQTSSLPFSSFQQNRPSLSGLISTAATPIFRHAPAVRSGWSSSHWYMSGWATNSSAGDTAERVGSFITFDRASRVAAGTDSSATGSGSVPLGLAFSPRGSAQAGRTATA